jgi:hypothetical protein
MIKWIIKKYLVGFVNDLLEDYKEDVDICKDTLNLWIKRIDKVLFTLRSMLSKLDDNKISDDEIQQSVEEITTCIKEW